MKIGIYILTICFILVCLISDLHSNDTWKLPEICDSESNDSPLTEICDSGSSLTITKFRFIHNTVFKNQDFLSYTLTEKKIQILQKTMPDDIIEKLRRKINITYHTESDFIFDLREILACYLIKKYDPLFHYENLPEDLVKATHKTIMEIITHIDEYIKMISDSKNKGVPIDKKKVPGYLEGEKQNVLNDFRNILSKIQKKIWLTKAEENILKKIRKPIENKLETNIAAFYMEKILFGSPLLSSFLNKSFLKNELSEKIQEISNKVSIFYYKHGYVNSGVKNVKIEQNGEVIITIVEGRISPDVVIEKMRFSEDLKLDHDYISCRLTLDADKQILNTNKLENRIRIMKQDPCIDNIHLAIKPDSTPGVAKLHATVKESFPYILSLKYNNYSPPSIGAYRFETDFTRLNLTGWGDVIKIQYKRTDQWDDYKNTNGLEDYSFDLRIPITRRDTKFYFSTNKSNSIVVVPPFNELDITCERSGVKFLISHPFYRSFDSETGEDKKFSISAGIERYKSKTFLQGKPFSFTGPENDTTVCMFTISPEWKSSNMNYAVYARLDLNAGLDIMGASIHGLGPDANFLYINAQFQWLNRLRPGRYNFFIPWKLYNYCDLICNFNCRLSEHPLVASEKFSIGGRSTVRGYRENRLTKDNGIVTSFELKVPTPNVQDWFVYYLLGPFILQSSKFCFFIDYGTGWNTKDNYLDIDTQTKTIYSLGGGWQLDRKIRLKYLEWKPLKLHAEIYWAKDINLGNQFGRLPRDIKENREREKINIQDQGIHFQIGIEL